jgi:anti-sigma factor ChrR (cupin superfamily)
MLKCKDIVANATDYVDKELSWQQAMSMALHLLICGHCRRFVKYFRLSLQVLQNKQTISQEEADSISAEVIAKVRS